MHVKKNGAQRVRLAMQIVVFSLISILALAKGLKDAGVTILSLPEISLHAVCPFGGVVTVYEFLSAGSFLPKIHSAAFILMALGLVVALLFGPLFCGYVCPLGSYQEWIGKLGRKLFPKIYGRLIPRRLDQVLRHLRYGVLAMVLYQTAAAGKLVFQEVDPYYALFNFFTGEVALSAIAVLLVVTVLSLFVERPWCKYLCPYGALLGLFNMIRVFPIRRNSASCIQCKKCDRACPMQIEVSKKGAVRDPQCISCHKCTSGSACPVSDTVTISFGKGGRSQ